MRLSDYIFFISVEAHWAQPDLVVAQIMQLAHNTIWGGRSAKRWWTRVSHTIESAFGVDWGVTSFHSIHGIHTMMCEDMPNKVCTLAMEATTEEGRVLHARFTFYPDDMGAPGRIFFSPVPFDSFGRPQLPHKLPPRFLEAVSTVLRGPFKKEWNGMALKEAMGHDEFILEDAMLCLKLMDKLMLIRLGAIADMSPETFEGVFGVRLPELPLQEQPPTGFTLGELALPSNDWRICGPLTDETANALACDFVNRRCVRGYVLIISTDPLRGIWYDTGGQHNLVEPTV